MFVRIVRYRRSFRQQFKTVAVGSEHFTLSPFGVAFGPCREGSSRQRTPQHCGFSNTGQIDKRTRTEFFGEQGSFEKDTHFVLRQKTLLDVAEQRGKDQTGNVLQHDEERGKKKKKKKMAETLKEKMHKRGFIILFYFFYIY